MQEKFSHIKDHNSKLYNLQFQYIFIICNCDIPVAVAAATVVKDMFICERV